MLYNKCDIRHLHHYSIFFAKNLSSIFVPLSFYEIEDYEMQYDKIIT